MQSINISTRVYHRRNNKAIRLLLLFIAPFFIWMQAASQTKMLSFHDYEDRVQGVWLAQIAGTLIAWPYEHQTASAAWLSDYPTKRTEAPVDDDWYYEMIAIRAFEKYGPGMTVEQLGKQWQENNAGTWGSSEQARLLMARGVSPRDAGHPRYNKLWFSIGPQFSADIYGALAPGMPNLAGKIARELCHLNGYAEGADGGVFIAAMVSLGFTEKDPKAIVRKAAKLIHPRSPYRQCLDLVIAMADKGKRPQEIFDAVEDRWHIEYPATNNAVANGGIVAASVWFGEGDFLKTVNLAASAADFTDADCNAANAASVIGAMKGVKGIPAHLVAALNDRIAGTEMGGFPLQPVVDEKISVLSQRTAEVGKKIMQLHGVKISGSTIRIPLQQPATQPAELFTLSELTQYWNPEWKLERAGYGGAGGGMYGIRGITYLSGDTLITYPRDEVRGLLLRRALKIDKDCKLSFEAGSDMKRAWRLQVYVNNKRCIGKLIEGNDTARQWQKIEVDLSEFKGQDIIIRIYQRVLIPGKEAGNAYWRNFSIE